MFMVLVMLYLHFFAPFSVKLKLVTCHFPNQRMHLQIGGTEIGGTYNYLYNPLYEAYVRTILPPC